MKLSIQAGSTSQTVNVFIQDSSSTIGAALTGLAYNSSGLVAYYALPRAAAVAITLATQTTTGAYSSGGFVEISSANMPGWYRLDIPDAAIASGRFTSIHIKGATNMAPCPLEIELTATNNQSATAFITGINSLAPPTNWNLVSIDANGRLDIIKVAGTSQTARDLGATLGAAGAGLTALGDTRIANLDATISSRTKPADTQAAVTTVTTTTNVTNAPTAGDFTSTMKTSLNSATPSVTVSDKTGFSLSVTPPTAVQIRTEMDSNSTKLANLDATVGSRSTYAGGAVASVTAAVTVGTITDKTGYSLTVTPPTAVQVRQEIDANSTRLDAAISTRSTPADILTQVNSALDAAGTELSSIPTTTGSLRQKINLLFQYFRNKRVISTTTETLLKEDASTTLGTSTVSDDGTLFIKGELG